MLVSDHILRKLECGVDEYLCLPCAGIENILAIGKRGFGGVYQILSVTYNCKIRKLYFLISFRGVTVILPV